jgi:hypothetical protein
MSEYERVSRLEEAWTVTKDEDGWSSVTRVNEYLMQENVNFSELSGNKNFSEVLAESKLFEFKKKGTDFLCRSQSYPAWLEHQKELWKQRVVDAWETTKEADGYASAPTAN